MDAQNIKNIANKALIAADQFYHSWSAEKQELFRATMTESAQQRVDAVLLKEVLDIQCTPENVRTTWRDLPLSKLNHLNWAKLLIEGIGNDNIFLNESMADNASLLDFNTLYDYDYDDHLFQEEANRKELKDYAGRNYYAFRFSRWARLIINEQLYYATLYSSASYLIERLDDQGSDIIKTLIPHEYVDGKNHGKREKDGFLWDVEIDAAGQEKQLDELKLRWYQYTQERWLELSKQFAHSDPHVYTEDKHENDELHRNFIFNNERALKLIRWRHFLADCEAIKGNYVDLAEMARLELTNAETWLKSTHQDILTNFDPDVVKLRRKKKIVVAPGAFDGLSGDNDNEYA